MKLTELEDAGWEVIQIGGCEVYILDMPNDSYFLATDVDGFSIPTDLNTIVLSHYDKHGEPIDDTCVLSLDNVLLVVKEAQSESNR